MYEVVNCLESINLDDVFFLQNAVYLHGNEE